MKLVSFLSNTILDGSEPIKLGAYLNDNQIVDLAGAAVVLKAEHQAHFQTMLDFLKAGKKARDVAEQLLVDAKDQDIEDCIYENDDIKLLSPLSPLSSLRDFMVFEDHIINCIRIFGLKKLGPLDAWIEKKWGRKYSLARRLNQSFYERPAYYKGNPRSVVGTDANVNIPRYTQKMDYELEFGVFIGKQGKNIAAKDAADYIAGYSIFNDFSARDEQLAEQAGRLGPAKGKDFDTGNAIGPYLVTPDEVGNPYNLTMVARVNGEQWSKGTTDDMYWRFEELIEYVSRDETLYPGDFLGSGTVGQGCGLELGRFLKPHDVVELEVEKLGILKNTVV